MLILQAIYATVPGADLARLEACKGLTGAVCKNFWMHLIVAGQENPLIYFILGLMISFSMLSMICWSIMHQSTKFATMLSKPPDIRSTFFYLQIFI